MNFLYICKVSAFQARGNQIDIPKKVGIDFFKFPESYLERSQNFAINICHASDPVSFESIEIQPATNFRFSTRLNSFLAQHKEQLEEGDLIIFDKIGKSFSVRCIKATAEEYRILLKLFEKDERHMILTANMSPTDSSQINHRNSVVPKNIKSYLPIIRTKPFLLLAGISGTGKSRIVKEMAFNSCPEDEELRKDEVSPGNYLLVEVKPNWHDSTELMGYESGIKKTYVTTPFIKFLYKAMHYPNTPFFVCLDEMNLAPVEQYFAEFLSVLESRKRSENEEIVSEPLISADVFTKYPDLYYDLNGIEKGQDTSHPAYGGKIVDDTITDYNQTDEVFKELCQYGLRIPHNVIVIGTVNMDETTHQFSRKVIDRAMTIEMNEVHFDSFFESNQDLGYTSTPLNASSFLAKFTSAKQALEYMQPQDADYIKSNLPSLLEGINDCLENTPFKIAYRVQNEIILYFAALREDDATAKSEILLNQALDDILMMKVLPRIEGDDELLEEPLKDLLAFSTNLPKSKVKVEEMQSRLGIGHFTSFWP